MNLEQLTYRNDLAVELMVKMATRPTMDNLLVERSFELADQACARIRADYNKTIETMEAKAANVRAARQAEFDALVGGIAACDSASTNTQNQGARVDRRKADCDCSDLRRSTDKVEVRELSPEQALDMIASLIFPPKR